MTVHHVNFRAQAAAVTAMTPELVAKALTKAAEQIEAYAKATDIAIRRADNLEVLVAELKCKIASMDSVLEQNADLIAQLESLVATCTGDR
jgi:type III secretion system FlhB-like substrate exporter